MVHTDADYKRRKRKERYDGDRYDCDRTAAVALPVTSRPGTLQRTPVPVPALLCQSEEVEEEDYEDEEEEYESGSSYCSDTESSSRS